MNLHLPKSIFFIAIMLFTSFGFAQATGDYRSNVNTTGIWKTSGSWETYNGSTWVAATNYPGEISGTYAVLIQVGDVINIGTTGITTQTMGTLTISGSLVLTGTGTGGAGTDFFFNTQTIIVTPLLGTIKFIDKVNLKLPTNATLQVKYDLTPNPDYYGLIGDCNNNQDIVIGSSTYAYCKGGGSTGLTFYEVMDGGGTLNSAPSSNSPICEGNTMMLNGSYIGPIGSGITYLWSVKAPNGSITTSASRDYSFSATQTGNYIATLTCSTDYNSVAYSNSETISVIVNAIPGAPVLGTITQPTCVLTTGSVVLSGLPSTGTWTLTRSPGAIQTTGTGTSTTISGLVAGDYYFAVNNGTCESVISSVVKIAGLKTTKWTNSGWDNGTPTIDENIIFDSFYSLPKDDKLEGCSCQVNIGKSVIINEGATLKIYNGVTVLETGTLTFKNNSSLVQINDAAVNSGNIIYKRRTNTGVRNTDYTYWSSPVSPLNLGGTGGILYEPLSLVGSIFYSYEVTAGSEDWKSESSTSQMIVGKGYSIRGPGPISASPLTQLEVTFTGKPNNGRYPITGIYPFKSYLIGNPYPSALDADKFLTDNAGVIDGTLYFWTHSTKIGINVVNPGTGVYAYSGDDYASYNLTGGVGTDGVPYPKGGVEAPNSPGFKPTGKIGAGQGFFATSNTTILGTNEIVFNNSMRVSSDEKILDNSQFFRTTKNSKTTTAIEKHRVWLNLTNAQGAFKQLLVGYITGATNEYDNGYDGETFDGNEFIDFYSVNQEKNFVIQGRALPFDVNDEVALGYRSVALGDFRIGIDEVDGKMQSQKTYIEDKLLNVVHDLTASPYDFTTQAGTFDDRFVLRYTDKTLAVDDVDTTNMQLVVSVKNKQLKVTSSAETIREVYIYNLLGKQLYVNKNIENKEFTVPNFVSNEQVLIVKTVLQDDKVVTSKTIFK